MRRSRGLVAKDWFEGLKTVKPGVFFVFASKDDFLGAV